MLIKIKNIKLKTIIGVYDWESQIERQIIINAKIQTNHEKSLISDNILDTINYDDLTSKIKDLVNKNRYKLIEKMAQEIMNLIMLDDRIESCKLEVEKVGAVENLEAVSVIIKEKRG